MLFQRVITAVILLLALILLTVYSTPFVFTLVLAAVTLMAAVEWTRFIGLTSLPVKAGYIASLLALIIGVFFLLEIKPSVAMPDQLRVSTILVLGVVFWIVAFLLIRGYPENKANWSDQSHIAVMGVFVLIPTWVGVCQLKYLDNSGLGVLSLVALVSVADIGAYFAGKAWGTSKLAVNLSPNKSWAGFWGGMVSCVLLAIILVTIVSRFILPISLGQSLLLIAGSGLVFVSSVVGDLFESMLKRNQQLKDSGNILPGHGGILDRIDSLTAATPVSVLLLITVFGNLWD